MGYRRGAPRTEYVPWGVLVAQAFVENLRRRGRNHRRPRPYDWKVDGA